MDIVSLLERKLKKANVSERPRILHSVYKQLVKSHKGRQTNGEFRDYANNEDDVIRDGLTLNLVGFVAEQLELYGIYSHAQRLREQYPAFEKFDVHMQKLDWNAPDGEQRTNFDFGFFGHVPNDNYWGFIVVPAKHTKNITTAQLEDCFVKQGDKVLYNHNV